ncbi:MAG: AtpZ/AtpI family protein [Rhizobiales bacterium]|nr:AtpZ/AtpI family protein [Hyphomicrobiales bacterium]
MRRRCGKIPHPRPTLRTVPGSRRGFKLSGDFVGGVVAGFAVGWGFDKLTGWSPWGLIVFLLLGFAAGVLNVLRSIGALPKYGEREK